MIFFGNSKKKYVQKHDLFREEKKQVAKIAYLDILNKELNTDRKEVPSWIIPLSFRK